MREGHERLVSEFGHLGLRMKPNSHALDKREFEKQSLPAAPTVASTRVVCGYNHPQ